jgi:hypothetical protein
MAEDLLMNIRNAKYNENGTIDCEIEHDRYGWIPHTASENDPETLQVYARILNGEAGDIAEYVSPPVDLDKLLNDKLSELKQSAQAEADNLTSSYPDFEKITWADQEREASAWLADNTVETPVLSAIAVARGLTLGELVPRVIDKAASFRTAASQIAGKRQALEDTLQSAYSANDVDAMVAIVWV